MLRGTIVQTRREDYGVEIEVKREIRERVVVPYDRAPDDLDESDAEGQIFEAGRVPFGSPSLRLNVRSPGFPEEGDREAHKERGSTDQESQRKD